MNFLSEITRKHARVSGGWKHQKSSNESALWGDSAALLKQSNFVMQSFGVANVVGWQEAGNERSAFAKFSHAFPVHPGT